MRKEPYVTIAAQHAASKLHLTMNATSAAMEHPDSAAPANMPPLRACNYLRQVPSAPLPHCGLGPGYNFLDTRRSHTNNHGLPLACSPCHPHCGAAHDLSHLGNYALIARTPPISTIPATSVKADTTTSTIAMTPTRIH